MLICSNENLGSSYFQPGQRGYGVALKLVGQSTSACIICCNMQLGQSLKLPLCVCVCVCVILDHNLLINERAALIVITHPA